MSRRALVCLILTVLLVAGATLGVGYWSLHQAPDFYAQELQRPVDPVQRKQAAKKFVQATLQLVDEIKNDDHWSEEFTQDQINAWLAEELPKKFPGWVPPNTSDPRVQFEDKAIEIAFRSTDPRFKGVISGRIEPFVAGPNEVGLRLRRVRLGLVPLPIDQVLEQIEEPLAEAVAEAEMAMRWEQQDGDDVLILTLKSEENRPVLESLHVKTGSISLAGSRRDLASAGPKEPVHQ